MKRMMILILCLLLVAPLSAHAAVFQDVQYVVDQADILTDQENIYLDNRAEAISDTWGVDVLIAAVETLDGETAENYAVSLTGERNWWDTDNAILFLLAMEEREWYIATFGDAIYIFDDYSLDQLGYGAADYFSEEKWYEGFSFYLEDMLPEYFEAARQNTFIEDGNQDPGYRQEVANPPKPKSLLSVLPLSALIGLVAAVVTILIMRSAMNTKRSQHSAGDYLTQGSYHLHRHQDIFLYSNVSKTRRQQNNNSSGGSSVHRSSGGGSHGGRGGKF